MGDELLSKIVWIAFFVLAFTQSPRASATSSQDSAWFLDSSRTVQYCILRDPSFSKSQAEIDVAVRWSLQQWQNYIFDNNLQDRPAPLQLATKFTHVESCENADLKFYFGIESSEIDTYKAEDFIHPVAFAKRLRYDPEGGWSQGLLWISNDAAYDRRTFWQKNTNFKAILLHEMGHVFGTAHSARTIMQETILDAILTDQEAGTFLLTHINNAWELVSSEKSAWKSGPHTDELGTMSAAAFSILIGRAPQGSVRGQWLTDRKQMIVQDDAGEYVLGVSVFFEKTIRAGSEPLFYAYRKDAHGQVFTANASRESFIKIGALGTFSGRSLNIVIEKNVGFRQLQISYQAEPNGGYEELFKQPCEIRTVPLHGKHCFPIYPNEEG